MVRSRLSPVNPGAMNLVSGPASEHSNQHDYGGAAGEQTERGVGQAGGLGIVALASQAGIDWNEGRRKHTLAEKVLQEIGNSKGGVECVRDIGKPEVVGESPLPHQPDQPTQQDAGSDEEGRSGRRG